jgi:tellurite resistance protein
MILLVSVIFTPLRSVQAAAADNAKQIIDATGIMKTDKGSNENQTAVITRARFAQMLVNASTLKASVSGKSNVSLFSDVKKSYWASGYIQTAVSQGWMSGYLNGTFKPRKGITLQEAVYGIVKLLGYSSSDFNGNISDSIMLLYKTKGLNKNISITKSQYMTVEDCYDLFYNTLKATTKAGTVYAVSLGYTVDSDGEPDYLSMISTSVKGPIVADENWKTKITFPASEAVFYKDGAICSLSDVYDYDVLYYSESFKMIWVYDNKVTGTIEAINPDYSNPQSVTVSGKSYTFTGSDSALKFSSMGKVKEGDIVTLVLDKNNSIVDVLSVDECNTTVTGVVINAGKHIAESDGSYKNTNYIEFVDASGNKYQQDYDSTSEVFYYGDLARLTYNDGTASVSKVTMGSISFGSNKFNSDGSILGDYKIASNAKLLDFENDQYISIYPERLAGVTLPASSVYYYELNKKGEISQIIFNNITGDMDKYGIFTGLNVVGASSKMSYSYLIGSTSGSLDAASLYSNVCFDIGPTGFAFTNNAITSSYALNEITVTSAIGTKTIQAGKVKYTLADKYNVY